MYPSTPSSHLHCPLQCFVAGVSVKFLLPGTDTPWQKVEELGWKDKIAMKVDSRNPYRYAPNGLTVVKVS